MKILDYKETMLRSKAIPMAKILRRNHALEDATWEVEYNMKEKYLKLFE